jgi:hypothetical protein|tara:strand:- start:2480 stop:3265 length:786 start_codon:yes stop_codon:yes gene_type:complete
MIQLKDVIGYPSLKYHLDNGLSLHEHVYRYSSDAFVNLFKEAREALRDEEIELSEEDQELLETTDIGEHGDYNGMKVPLDLPMVSTKYNPLFEIGSLIDEMIEDENTIDEASTIADMINFEQIEELVSSIGGQIDMDKFKKAVTLQNETFDFNGFELIKASVTYMNELEYKGKKVKLNKPKRGGSKKFYVYVKSKKGNVKKVSFGDTNLSVKFKQKGARASFAARHKCATKKDKTKAGYWSCNIGRYWKSLGGSANFSGYW